MHWHCVCCICNSASSNDSIASSNYCQDQYLCYYIIIYVSLMNQLKYVPHFRYFAVGVESFNLQYNSDWLESPIFVEIPTRELDKASMLGGTALQCIRNGNPITPYAIVELVTAPNRLSAKNCQLYVIIPI